MFPCYQDYVFINRKEYHLNSYQGLDCHQLIHSDANIQCSIVYIQKRKCQTEVALPVTRYSSVTSWVCQVAANWSCIIFDITFDLNFIQRYPTIISKVWYWLQLRYILEFGFQMLAWPALYGDASAMLGKQNIIEILIPLWRGLHIT